MDINFYNRYTDKNEIEKVYGEGFLRWLYESSSGKMLAPVLVKKFLSKAYGYLQNTKISSQKIIPFIAQYDINMDNFEKNLPENYAGYDTFNDFFIRKYKKGKRPYPTEPNLMGAIAEGRYLGWEQIKEDQTFPVKGRFLDYKAILGNPKWYDEFCEGPLVIARLCPVDYHRFHFPDDGEVVEDYRVEGVLHSVNPLAISLKEDIFLTNERHVTILDTKNFGKLAYIEVGAICVGKIKQSYSSKSFKRGDEKGYFLFGGSTVILLGQKGKLKLSQDIIKNTNSRIETYVRLGDTIAESI